MGQARRSTREPPVPSSSRTLAARLQAVPAASNRRAVRLTVIAHTRLASTAQGFPKRLMVQVQGHLAPWERACQRLPHASRHAEANDHSTRTTGIGPGAKLARAVVAFLFPLDRWQPQQRNHRTSYSTTCANTKRFLPPPCPREGTPIHPRLKKNGAFWAVLCKSIQNAPQSGQRGILNIMNCTLLLNIIMLIVVLTVVIIFPMILIIALIVPRKGRNSESRYTHDRQDRNRSGLRKTVLNVFVMRPWPYKDLYNPFSRNYWPDELPNNRARTASANSSSEKE